MMKVKDAQVSGGRGCHGVMVLFLAGFRLNNAASGLISKFMKVSI